MKTTFCMTARWAVGMALSGIWLLSAGSVYIYANDELGRLINRVSVDIRNAPVPKIRPAPIGPRAQNNSGFLSNIGLTHSPVAARSGSLSAGLEAVESGEILQALAIRAGLKDPVDQAILSWFLARQNTDLVPYDMIVDFQRQYPDFPSQSLLRHRAEVALARQKLGWRQVLQIYEGYDPVSVDGKLHKASALVAARRSKQAEALIRDLWRTTRLPSRVESRIRKDFGHLLDTADHKWRMDMHLYDERSSEAMRIAKILGGHYLKLAEARDAVNQRQKGASLMLRQVPSTLQKDHGYIFSQIQQFRRTQQYSKAAALLLKAPTDPNILVDPDEWWVERRLVSRHMLDLGKADMAYKIAAAHRGGSAATIVDAQFHAGWYALRYMNEPGRSRPHFQAIADIATRPRSLARAFYWLGRAAEAEGQRAKAVQHYRQAAQYVSVFYGQLANEKLGRKQLAIRPNPKADQETQARFNARVSVKAIQRLLQIDRSDLAGYFFRSLAQTLKDPAEIVLLAQLAENNQLHSFALQVGKLAELEGHVLPQLAFPVAAIPKSVQIPQNVGHALVYSVARQESAFNVRAVSRVGARGLLQLMPATAKEVSSKLGLTYSKSKLLDDPAYNVTLGAAYLDYLLDQFDRSLIMTFAGYNAGGYRVRGWVKTYGDPRSGKVDAVDWIERIPFTETRNYVQKILENMQIYQALLNERGLSLSRDMRRRG